MATAKLIARTVEAAKPAEDALSGTLRESILWDTELRGFGLRVSPQGHKSFLVQYRAGRHRGARQRRMKVGDYGEAFTAEQARKKARQLLGTVQSGTDPVSAQEEQRKASRTLKQVWEDFIAAKTSRLSLSTVQSYTQLYNDYLAPRLATRTFSAIDGSDLAAVERAALVGVKKERPKKKKKKKAGKKKGANAEPIKQNETAEAKTPEEETRPAKISPRTIQANRTRQLVSAIWHWAQRADYIPADHRMPYLSWERYAEKPRQRFLSPEEIGRLADVLVQEERAGTSVARTNVIRGLLLTGCRFNEIASLRWTEVDLENGFLRLSTSKTGARAVPLGAAAIEFFTGLPHLNAFVFPAENSESRRMSLRRRHKKPVTPGPVTTVPKLWRRVRKTAKLPGVRLHDLRHTMGATIASGSGSLLITQKILGHTQSRTTLRYAHMSDSPVRAAADKASGEIAAALKGSTPTPVTDLTVESNTRRPKKKRSA
jgi:integrase